MKTIQLTKGFVALVDDADYERVSALSWHANVQPNSVYAMRKQGRKSSRHNLYLHRFIMGVSDPKVKVDHKDHDGLNCQRLNLRMCSNQKNQCNRRKHRGSSRYKGVCWHKRDGKFQTEIKLEGRSKFLGMFTDELDAALAYDSAAREHFGEFACCNFPLKKPCTNTLLALESQHREYVS